MENTESANHHDDEIDLKELLSILWSDKLRIVAIAAAFAVGSLFYALVTPNQYKATVVLAPAQAGDGGLSSALGQLTGLASLAGVSIGEGGSNESQIAQEIMNSWGFMAAFIEENKLTMEVYAVDGWNRSSGELLIDDGKYDVLTREWLLEDQETGELRPPTSWELYERFQEIVTVSEDKLSGLVSVSVEYYSPQHAKQWVDMYVTAINKHMQTRQVSKVANNIRYLEAQIESTSIAEMREVFFTIIEEQTKNKMVAEASPDYVFVTVSPSMVPEENSKPRRAIISIVGTILGLVLGVIAVLLRSGSLLRW